MSRNKRKDKQIHQMKRRRRTAATQLLTRKIGRELGEAQLLTQRGRLGEARKLLERLAQQYPRSADVLGQLLNVCFDQNDMAAYLSACERLAPLVPDDSDIQLALAGSYLSNMYPLLARRQFQRFLERWPHDPRAKSVRETVASLSETIPRSLAHNSAIQELGEEGFKLLAMHEDAVRNLHLAKYAECIATGQRLLARLPGYAPVLNNMSAAHFALGQTEKAVETARQILQLEPDNFHAQGNLVRFFCQSGRLEEARAAAEQLKAMQSVRHDLLLKQLESFSVLGDDANVVALFTAGESPCEYFTPHDHALARHFVAVATLRLGDEARAKSLWKKSLQLDPHLTVARENLDDLRKPVGERQGPWALTLDNFISRETANEFLTANENRSRGESEADAARHFLERHPRLETLVPSLLDRGDPAGRQFAIMLAKLVQSASLLEALREFALGQRGSDRLRVEAADFLCNQGVLPRGQVRLWHQGQWRELLLMSFDVHDEPEHNHAAQVEELAVQAIEALQANEPVRAETLLRRALEFEPDAPDLVNNLAGALALQRRTPEAYSLLRENHRRHPDYFFGRTEMAKLKTHDGDLEQGRALLEPLLAIRRLHHTEFAALCSAQIEVAMAENKNEGARSWLAMWERMDPNAPGIKVYAARLRINRTPPKHDKTLWPWEM